MLRFYKGLRTMREIKAKSRSKIKSTKWLLWRNIRRQKNFLSKTEVICVCLFEVVCPAPVHLRCVDRLDLYLRSQQNDMIRSTLAGSLPSTQFSWLPCAARISQTPCLVLCEYLRPRSVFMLV